MHIKVLVIRDPASGPHKPKRRWLRAGAAGVVLASGLAVVTGALAFASIPDANGVFHGCVRTATGAIRIIDTGQNQTCRAGETAVSWNKAGINWQGAWAPRTSYGQGDAVSYQGSSYLAVVANTNVVPTSPAHWAVLAQAGAPGQNGTNGTNGATILSGVGPPSDKIGNTGDFYIAKGLIGGVGRPAPPQAIYGPAVRTCKTFPCTTSWGQGSSIVGPSGPAGAVAAAQTTSGRVDLENGDATIITEQTAQVTGDFAVNAVVAVDNQSGTSGWVCTLYAANPGASTGLLLDQEGATAPQGGTSSNATIVLTAVVSIAQGGKTWVGCNEYVQRKDDSATARIISTQLASFTTGTQTGVD
ncbi:MAG: carbohydrate-binding protein [Acidimicrobiales bacterium]|uniref:carbohydrate-binding protein n=1 Tax=Mycobacterium sp. TaxID=1785 RepID=UPI003F9E4B10